MATANQSGKLFLFDWKDNWKKFSFNEQHNKMVRGLAFSSDSLKLISGSDDQLIKIFDLKSQKQIMQLTGHKGNINCIDSSPVDDNIFISW